MAGVQPQPATIRPGIPADVFAPEVEAVQPRGLARGFQSLQRSPVGAIGASLIAIVLFVAIFGDFIAPHEAAKANFRARYQPPAWQEGGDWIYPLGTDQLGRDILSRIIIGSRVSVIVGLMTVLVAGSFGVLVGLVSGFLGGWVDLFLMRIVDASLAIPYIVLVVAVSGVVGPGLITLIVILSLLNWQAYSRVVRGEVLSARELEYVVAARVIGQTRFKIMLRHILPNVTASVIVLATLQVAITILAESSLSFLGLGVQPPDVTWGLVAADGRAVIGSAWWISTMPGIAISLAVLGIIFLGDWLRDVLDPRLDT
jgi:peptide/nickel transport system permease protein